MPLRTGLKTSSKYSASAPFFVSFPMDRFQLFLVGLPVFLFCSDVLNLFTRPPSHPSSHHHHHHPRHHQQNIPSQGVINKPPDFPVRQTTGDINEIGYGTVINLSFCSSCSYRGTAVTMKKMLETSFPGVEVILSNHPPTLPKRLLGKVVPVVQFGMIAIVMAGEHIFPRLGYMAPPAWYFSLRANRFGTIASTWLLGNVVQNYLQSSGAFEVYCNGDLVFSKLREHRFPGEIELRDLVSQKLAPGGVVDGVGSLWS